MIGNEQDAEALATLVSWKYEAASEGNWRLAGDIIEGWSKEFGFSPIGEGTFRIAFRKGDFVYKVNKSRNSIRGNDKEWDFFAKHGGTERVMGGITFVFPEMSSWVFEGIRINCLPYFERPDSEPYVDTWGAAGDWYDFFPNMSCDFHPGNYIALSDTRVILIDP